VILLQGIAARRVSRWALLALFLFILGAAGGYAARELRLTSYQASSSVVLEDPQLFRRLEPLLRSQASVERFAAQGGLTNDPAIHDLLRQFALNRGEPASFKIAYPVTRTDLRDVPEAVSRDMFKEQRIRAVLAVEIGHRNEQEAQRRHKILLAYVRDALLRHALTDSWILTSIDARNRAARLASEVSDTRWTLESLSRRIKEMTEIRGKYEESGAASEQLPSTGETIQIPTADTRFLSPRRQLVGFEAQRAELEEQLRRAAGRQAQDRVTERYATAMLARAEGNDSAADLLRAAFSELEQIKSDSNDADITFGIDGARNNLLQALYGIRGRYVDPQPDPPEPVVFRSGPGLGSAIGVGGLIGLLIWLLLFRFLNRSPAPGAELTRREQGSLDPLRPPDVSGTWTTMSDAAKGVKVHADPV
jgi:hypothetical protein